MTKSHSFILPLAIFVLLFVISDTNVMAQTRLVLNGAKINITAGAYLVIENPAADAITRTDGHIISEGENNILQWNIGTTTGTYTVPWGYGDTDYIPLSFTKTAGTGSGLFLFSTYRTGWENSGELPTGVTHLNGASGSDNSAYVIDRFWRIEADDYTAKPALSSLTFTYLDAEFAAPNTIDESNLSAERWNSDLTTWTDYSPEVTVNAASNTLTVTSVDATNLYSWWALNYLSDRHWIGAASTAWSDPANWSGAAGGTGGMDVPTTIDAVYFDGVDDTNAVLDTDITVSDFTVASGYTGTITQGTNIITINNDATFSDGIFQGGSANITVGGNFTISGGTFRSTSAILDLKGNYATANGSFVHQNGTVSFSGTDGTTQTISGLPVTNFNNITVSNTSANPGVSVQSSQNLRGALTLADNVTFDADGSANTSVFKLISLDDAPTTRDASIGALPAGAQVSGNITVQRYMEIEGANGGRIYRYISSPVQNATVADLQTEIAVTGSFTGSSACSGCTSSQSMFRYNEAIITDTNGSGTANADDGYVDFPETTNTETLATGRGYALYVRGNLLSTSALWDVKGTVNNANVTPVSFPVSFTSSGTLDNDGWNLIGNPFPSTMDWNAASGWTKTNIEGTIYFRDNAAGVAASWNGTTGTNGGSRYIAIGQAFWVKASGAPVLQATESVKAAGTQTIFFREESLENLLRVTMVKGTTRDEAVIHFREDATSGFDVHADARKLLNTTFNISTLLTDGKGLSINSLPSLNCNTSTKVMIENTVAGNYSLNFSEVESFPDHIIITLLDSYTGSSTAVSEGTSVNFAVSSDPASYGANRFTLNFATPPVSTDFELQAPDLCEGNDAVIQLSGSQNGAHYSALIGAETISSTVHGNGGDISLIIPKNNLITGTNTITIKSAIEHCSTTIEKNINFNIEKITSIDSVSTEKGCPGEAVTVEAFSTSENGHYNWYESATALDPLPDQHTSSFTTPVLEKSSTYYVSAINALGCEGERMPVSVEIIALDEAQINVSGDSLVSNHITGNQWYFNQQPIAGATGQSIKPEASGIYTVAVTTDGCTTSADREFVVTGVEERSTPFIHVSPNPTGGEFNIEISDSFRNAKEVRVINSLGQVIGFIELQQNHGKKTGKFSMANYPSGIYIIQIMGGGGASEVKLVRQ